MGFEGGSVTRNLNGPDTFFVIRPRSLRNIIVENDGLGKHRTGLLFVYPRGSSGNSKDDQLRCEDLIWRAIRTGPYHGFDAATYQNGGKYDLERRTRLGCRISYVLIVPNYCECDPSKGNRCSRFHENADNSQVIFVVCVW